MSDLEKTGMLKMDFLALTALTVINDCLISIKQLLEVEINWADIALNDEKTMAVFGKGARMRSFSLSLQGCRRFAGSLTQERRGPFRFKCALPAGAAGRGHG